MKYAVVLGVVAVLTLGTCAFAQEPEGKAFLASAIKVLNADEVAKLSDKDLTNAYIDVSVEIEAQKSLHATSGYMPKEYNHFKDLLRYRIVVLSEMKKRKLEVPEV